MASKGWITARQLVKCVRCGGGVKSTGKCFTCGLQLPGFSLAKGGRRYESEEERVWNVYNIDDAGGDDRTAAGV